MNTIIKRVKCKNGMLEIPYLDKAFLKRLDVNNKKILNFVRKTARDLERGKDVNYNAYCLKIGEYFDNIFGKGAAKIVFGGNAVSSEMCEEFMDKLAKLYVEWASQDIGRKD